MSFWGRGGLCPRTEQACRYGAQLSSTVRRAALGSSLGQIRRASVQRFREACPQFFKRPTWEELQPPKGEEDLFAVTPADWEEPEEVAVVHEAPQREELWRDPLWSAADEARAFAKLSPLHKVRAGGRAEAGWGSLCVWPALPPCGWGQLCTAASVLLRSSNCGRHSPLLTVLLGKMWRGGRLTVHPSPWRLVPGQEEVSRANHIEKHCIELQYRAFTASALLSPRRGSGRHQKPNR